MQMETKRKVIYYTHIRKIDFNKKCFLKKSLHYNKVVNPKREHNICQYLCTQYRSTEIHKLACCSTWDHKESDRSGRLNNNNKIYKVGFPCVSGVKNPSY